MDKVALAAAGLDYEDGVRRCGGSPELYEKLLELFLEDSNMAEARQHLEAQDLDGFFGNIHEVKGMSGNLSITELYRISSQVVELLREGNGEEAAQRFADLEVAYADATKAISDQLTGE